MPITFFRTEPKNQKDADEKCIAFLETKEINEITRYIYKNIKHKKKFMEALKCYRSKYYVASAMILTSLIERKITEMPLENKDEKKGRGQRAIIEKFKNKIISSESSEEKYKEDVIELFYLTNLIAYLTFLFADGGGFEKQRYNINRNFLMHGWRDTETTKTDCKKLFLALYNILYIWENK